MKCLKKFEIFLKKNQEIIIKCLDVRMSTFDQFDLVNLTEMTTLPAPPSQQAAPPSTAQLADTLYEIDSSTDTDDEAPSALDNLNEQVHDSNYDMTNNVQQDSTDDSPPSPDRYISYQELSEKYAYLLD